MEGPETEPPKRCETHAQQPERNPKETGRGDYRTKVVTGGRERHLKRGRQSYLRVNGKIKRLTSGLTA